MTAETAKPLLPYAFVRDFGVLASQSGCDSDGAPDGGAILFMRPNAPLAALCEALRNVKGDVRIVPEEPEAFAARVARTYRETAREASQAAEDDGDLVSLADSAATVDDLLEQADDAPVVRLINALLLEAIRERASDVHIEPQERQLLVRFRIDGSLREVLAPNRKLAPLLVSRIKIMARLDIAEKRLPQDGRVSLRVGRHEVDVRVSTLPSQHGERVVLRLLDRGSARFGIERLGMSLRDSEVFASLLARPNGMLLVTGPTGSGKTTTLYAALDHLNDRSRNIITVEDPIEYALEGIGQTQVNTKSDLTFARGLRAILRQDPDIIMVGEIRDKETAQVAAEAAMTGHFVLTTLHTNTAIGAVARLLDLGVDRFLLAPLLAGVVAQRLVRRLCLTCHVRAPAPPETARLLQGLAIGTMVASPKGCPDCQGQGYSGRAALYEVIRTTPEIQRLIHAGASEAELTLAARRDGPSLLADGLRLVTAGITSVEEVCRVVREG